MHHGINLAFEGGLHRIDLTGLSGGMSVLVYPQHEVLVDLIAGASPTAATCVSGPPTSPSTASRATGPTVTFSHEGAAQAPGMRLRGGRRRLALAVPQSSVTGRTGLLPPVPLRLVRHPRGGPAVLRRADLRALRSAVSCWSPRAARPCSGSTSNAIPAPTVEDWSDDRIWAEFAARLAPARGGGEGRTDLQEGRAAVPRRSWPSRCSAGRLFLAGDAAHTVPPTGAKGLNLAVADVQVLDRAFGAWYASGEGDRSPPSTAPRSAGVAGAVVLVVDDVDAAPVPDAGDFDLRRQIAELQLVTSRKRRPGR